jgi:Immunity protein 8
MDDLEKHVPENLEKFCVSVRAMVGPRGSDGEDSFDINVCSPKWLEEQVERHGFVLGRHYLFVPEYDPAKIRKIQGICCRFEKVLRRSESTLDRPSLKSGSTAGPGLTSHPFVIRSSQIHTLHAALPMFSARAKRSVYTEAKLNPATCQNQTLAARKPIPSPSNPRNDSASAERAIAQAFQ